MNSYSEECGFDHEWSKDDYIPESLFYMLGFKAGNDRALKYQQWLAFDVLPSIRKTGTYTMPKAKDKQASLSSVNTTVKTITEIYKSAGVDPAYIAVAARNIYKEKADINIPLPIEMQEEKLYDNTTIATELGVMSTSGKPHGQAVGAILKKIDISESEIIRTPFSRNGHDGITKQYKCSVLEKVKDWLEEYDYPTKIQYQDSKGSAKTCTVSYAAA